MSNELNIEQIAIQRAREILNAWWNEDIWEFAEENGLSDQQERELLDTDVNISTENFEE